MFDSWVLIHASNFEVLEHVEEGDGIDFEAKVPKALISRYHSQRHCLRRSGSLCCLRRGASRLARARWPLSSSLSRLVYAGWI